MFTKLPKSDVLPKIFVKMTQKIQILLDILHKSASQTPATYAYIVCTRLFAVIRQVAVGCTRLSAVTKQVAKLETSLFERDFAWKTARLSASLRSRSV